MLQTNPPPTFKLMQQFQADKEYIEGLLDDLDGLYGDICMCDPTNTQGYMDKCEEQHIRSQKPIADLMDAANTLEVNLRQCGIGPDGQPLSESKAHPSSRDVSMIDPDTDSDNHLVKYRPNTCLLYTSPSPRDKRQSRMPSSA